MYRRKKNWLWRTNSNIQKTNCSFANRIIKRLKNDGIIENLPIVLSYEKPKSCQKILIEEKIQTQTGKIVEFKKITPSTTPFVASAAGILIGSYVVRRIINY